MKHEIYIKSVGVHDLNFPCTQNYDQSGVLPNYCQYNGWLPLSPTVPLLVHIICFSHLVHHVCFGMYYTYTKQGARNVDVASINTQNAPKEEEGMFFANHVINWNVISGLRYMKTDRHKKS